MIRKQVYIEAEQEEALKRKARDQDVPESELIRRGIDLVTRDELRSFPDKQAWQEELAFLRERSLIPALGKSRSWTRDELYDRR